MTQNTDGTSLHRSEKPVMSPAAQPALHPQLCVARTGPAAGTAVGHLVTVSKVSSHVPFSPGPENHYIRASCLSPSTLGSD